MQPVDALAEQLLLLPAAEFQVVNEKPPEVHCGAWVCVHGRVHRDAVARVECGGRVPSPCARTGGRWALLVLSQVFTVEATGA